MKQKEFNSDKELFGGMFDRITELIETQNVSCNKDLYNYILQIINFVLITLILYKVLPWLESPFSNLLETISSTQPTAKLVFFFFILMLLPSLNYKSFNVSNVFKTSRAYTIIWFKRLTLLNVII